MKNNQFLFLLVLTYFALGFVNIHFAILGLVCMMLPFILLFRNRKKTWCQGYCPRASLLSTTGKLTSKFSLKTPAFFIQGKMKWIMLIYFGISLTFITMSTVRVGLGFSPALEYLRFLIVIPLPFEMPQLIIFERLPVWLTHLSYRFYSMMLTTTFIGVILSLVYKPRTWCTICPISTISGVYIKYTR